MQDVLLLAAIRRPGGQCELAGVFWVFLQTQPAHLDAVLEEVTRSGVALFFVQGLAEDDDLLEEENSSLLHPGQKSSILV